MIKIEDKTVGTFIANDSAPIYDEGVQPLLPGDEAKDVNKWFDFSALKQGDPRNGSGLTKNNWNPVVVICFKNIKFCICQWVGFAPNVLTDTYCELFATCDELSKWQDLGQQKDEPSPYTPSTKKSDQTIGTSTSNQIDWVIGANSYEGSQGSVNNDNFGNYAATSRNVDNPKVFHWSPIFSNLGRITIGVEGIPNPADIVIWMQFGAWAILITNDGGSLINAWTISYYMQTIVFHKLN